MFAHLASFIALAYDARNEESALQAAQLASAIAVRPGWRERFSAVGLRIFDNAPSTEPVTKLPSDSGVLYGTWFSEPNQESPSSWTSGLAATQARHLVESGWGGYVAVWKAADSKTAILRDPSGRIPCHFYFARPTLAVIFSEPEQIVGLLEDRLTVNWRFIESYLLNVQTTCHETAFSEVSNVVPGELVTFDDQFGVAQSQIWDASAIAADSHDSFEDACTSVEISAQRSADAWATRYRRAILSLSGGLDSSAIAGLLSRSRNRPAVLCSNMFGADKRADERHFAAEVAHRAGFEIVYDVHPAASVDLRSAFEEHPLTVVPSTSFTTATAARQLEPLHREFDSDSYWTGLGGDHLFTAEGNLVARDFVRERRTPFGLVSVARDAAAASGISIGKILREAFRGDHDRFPVEAIRPHYLSAHMKALRPLQNPMLVNTARLPPGRARLVSNVAKMARNMSLAKLAARPVVDLYNSQPLVEACLRVPSYFQAFGGVKRSVQRSAFAKVLPTSVRERQGKGSISGDAIANFLTAANIEFIRDTMLGGSLMTRDIFDRAAIERFLMLDRPTKHDDIFGVVSAVTAEAWMSKSRAAGLLH